MVPISKMSRDTWEYDKLLLVVSSRCICIMTYFTNASTTMGLRLNNSPKLSTFNSTVSTEVSISSINFTYAGRWTCWEMKARTLIGYFGASLLSWLSSFLGRKTKNTSYVLKRRFDSQLCHTHLVPLHRFGKPYDRINITAI
jgi:hypothetical protein